MITTPISGPIWVCCIIPIGGGAMCLGGRSPWMMLVAPLLLAQRGDAQTMARFTRIVARKDVASVAWCRG
ncbi:unnamed protein product [Chondrus crispus]|uniref:Uncharacterized protein n=1 Tax=Chondrus crispus TaxID=2769 RepID=R7QRD5_CHOCR|nr:unnamed protein product [Chondrus crispus]CDF40709.1 unnamed protein product [Chondrus crispus]|eukprot:XP_005711003.1 unnamed protein product [Chondrus crispus]